MKNKIAITTGDLLGVGEEITYKALKALNLDRNEVILIGKNIGLDYDTIEIDDKDNGKFCYESLETACRLALEEKIKGIVTAPVSKETLHKSGYFFSGQTEILEKLLSTKKDEKAEMLFIAGDLRVMLLTRHCPLAEIKIAITGLNPHCGENGILGNEEITTIIPAVKKLNETGILAYGPYSADGLFGKIGKNYLKGNKQEYDAVITMYHDQGLCPIKALCFDKCVNTTIGLKVIRTSPPTGTACDIKGKNIADPSGMIEAIKLHKSF